MSKSNSLATVTPDVAKSWCYEENTGTPQDHTSRSGYKAIWNCTECGNQWSTTIVQRVAKGSGCPKCYGKRAGHRKDVSRHKHPTFAKCNHTLLSEWDHDRNAEQGMFPEDITLSSQKLVHWVSCRCSLSILHRWMTPPHARTKNQRGCPYCSGHAVCKCNSLATRCPELAQEWDYSKNEAALMHTLLTQINLCGGRLQAEAAGAALVIVCAAGHNNSVAPKQDFEVPS